MEVDITGFRVYTVIRALPPVVALNCIMDALNLSSMVFVIPPFIMPLPLFDPQTLRNGCAQFKYPSPLVVTFPSHISWVWT
jgi:hypothetical protein